MQIASFLLAFFEVIALFNLNSNFTLSYVVEFWKAATDIFYYFGPLLRVEARIHLRDLADYYPRVEF